MDLWVDLHSGTYGAGLDAIVYINLTDEEEEIFAALSDDDRVKVAKFLNKWNALELCDALTQLNINV